MPKTHRIRRGECIETLGEQYGFFPETIWRHRGNEGLRRKRESMNLLAPGDEVEIPDLRPRQESKPTEKLHRFRRKGVPSRFQVRFLDESGNPIADAPFRTLIDGKYGPEGMTDADGVLDIPVPPRAKQLAVTLETDIDWAKETRYQLSDLEPPDSIAGVQARLLSLDYYEGEVDGRISDALGAAVSAFQSAHDLSVDGAWNQPAFRDRLCEVYGC